MRIGRGRATLLAAVLAAAACSGGIFRQYEYEEDVYLSLDGSATVYVNASVAAIDALRGAAFDASPSATFDRDAFRRYYSSPATHVTRVSSSRRSGRRFVHVRMEVDDIRRLPADPPFAWSAYDFARRGELFEYRQTIGAAAAKPVADAGWTGREIVAFRLHLPSKIAWHNAPPGNLKRGNILVWEQPLADRLRGVPLTLEARMETQSILYRTLWLFGATFVAVALSFGVVIWWILRRAPAAHAGAP
ncbi:MAG TPA: hypothetical protein VL309_00685 [Vicinamibacterales bacterium]|jgi:hypothetical protein|nr:hypothetical protein [Vicinamibacterales bacterium]